MADMVKLDNLLGCGIGCQIHGSDESIVNTNEEEYMDGEIKENMNDNE